MLWREAADELAAWCCTSATLDFKKLESRVESEGMSFLTITLPNFGKDFEKSLDQKFVGHDLFLGFKRKGGLPLFLGGFLDLVFDRGTGLLLDEPCVDSIFAVRQLTLMFGKIEIECSKERTARAMQNYIECEREVDETNKNTSEHSLLEITKMAGLLWGDVLSRMDDIVYSGDVIPKHGPGATADRLTGNGKYDQTEWTLRLEELFPFGDYALPNWRYYYQLDRVNFHELEAERPVKVITVPKTLKTPRIIAIEPTCMQYMQQALLDPLVELLESRIVPGNTRENLTCGMIGFRDQNPNRDLARQGSYDGSLATLDLSEASDRVSNLHVIALTAYWPTLSRAIQATRSMKADVPGTGEITLAKFASMGSALCFPMESMIFLTLIFLGIQEELSRQLTRRDIESLRGKVRVYGDDIVVPVEYVRCVLDTLNRYGYKVNVNKSFWTGKFRESCGGDYYDGHDVTPIRVRRLLPSARTDVSEVISLVETRNQFYSRGLWRTTRYLDRLIGNILPHFPIVEDTSPALGRRSFLPYSTERECPSLHRPLVKAFVAMSRPPASLVSGEGALVKCLIKRGDQPFEDARHLERQGRPQSVDIKLRWMTPF